MGRTTRYRGTLSCLHISPDGKIAYCGRYIVTPREYRLRELIHLQDQGVVCRTCQRMEFERRSAQEFVTEGEKR